MSSQLQEVLRQFFLSKRVMLDSDVSVGSVNVIDVLFPHAVSEIVIATKTIVKRIFYAYHNTS